MRSILVMLCLLAQSYFIMAQRQADVIVPFDKNIETIVLNSFTGSIIVKEKDKVSSYNPDDNKIEWNITKDDLVKKNLADKLIDADAVLKAVDNKDLNNLLDQKKDEIFFISNSPFVNLVLDDNIDVIINSLDGNIVFNSLQAGCRIIQSEYMPQEKAFLFMVIDKSNYSCIYYDLATNSQKWVSELAPVESFFKSLGSFFKSSGIPVEDKAITTNQYVYASINGKLYKMNKADGKILWASDFILTNFNLSDDESSVITTRSASSLLSTKIAMNLLNAETGEKLWKDDLTTKYISYIEDAGDRILVAHENGFNFYNYTDGKKVWKKDAKGDKIKQVIPVGDDYLYVADKEMNLINKDGISQWKKTIEICDNKEDEVYYLGRIDNNRVFYLTDSYGNMVDYTTGKKIWKKDVKFDKNRPVLYTHDEKQNIYLVYNDKKLYKFDPNGENEKHEPLAKLKSVRSDHTMSDIELFDWGISLVSQGDVIGISFDGETKYHNMYKEPGGNKRGWLRGGMALASFVTTGKGSFKQDGGGGFGMSVGNHNDFDNLTDGVSAYDKMVQRFNALKLNDEYAFVINKAEGGGAELVKVRKIDGEEVDRISVEGTKPLYEVDSYNDNMYYVHKNELRVYNKK